VSAKTLQDAFRRFRGISPREAIRAARMSRAQELLRTSNLRVGEIAATLGYSTPCNFSRDFARYFGVPPSRIDAVTSDAEVAARTSRSSSPAAR